MRHVEFRIISTMCVSISPVQRKKKKGRVTGLRWTEARCGHAASNWS